ncbi:MAG: DUF2807 domain-containing protein [Bacteroidales bacterium]|nr:DUF2807 domain-containing protein [Bacteroidales bacterium]
MVKKEFLSEFKTLKLNSMFDITLVDSSVYSITVETYENIIPMISMERKNDTLNLKNDYNCTWLKKEDMPKIRITAPNIEEVLVDEACNIRTDGILKYDKFLLEVKAKIVSCDLNLDCTLFSGKFIYTTGDYYIRGVAAWVSFLNYGKGNLHAENFKCNHLDLMHNSVGYSNISCYGYLKFIEIKLGYVYLFTAQCPNIIFENNEDKKLLFTEGCLNE